MKFKKYQPIISIAFASLLFVPSNLHHESVKPIYLKEIKTSNIKLDNTNNKLIIQQEKFNKKEEKKETLNFLITGYTPFCNTGCIGITTTGFNVKNNIYYNGMRIIAVDPKVIPLYSIININYGGEKIKAIALDTGGKIDGHHIDLLFKLKENAINFGVKHLEIEIVRWGK